MNLEQTGQLRYNIATSSDDTLIPQIAVSLTAMARNLKEAQIDFYLLHGQVSAGNINMLSALCQGLGNISFHQVRVPEPEAYDPLVEAGGWLRETYYPLCAHEMLPDDVDRVLYLDAGDTLVIGDIAPYYTEAFGDAFLIVTGQKYKVVNGTWLVPEPDDLENQKEFLPGILEGLFNSGSYMINLRKMREAGIDLSYYYDCTERLRGTGFKIKDREMGGDGDICFGDQGLLSAAFIGRLKYFGYPQIRDPWYNPYNFCIGYYDHFDRKPDYQPAILHFAGVPFKPWKANYPIFPERFKRSGGTAQELSRLKPLQLEYYFLWLEYLFLTDKVLSMLGI